MENLRTALAMAASGAAGVFLAFDRKVMLGCRAVKIRTTDFDAFESVNWPLAASVDGKGLQLHPEAIPRQTGECALRDRLCDKCSHQAHPGWIRRSSTCCSRCTTGASSSRPSARRLHFVRRDLIAKLQAAARAGITVVVCSQCLYEPQRLLRLRGGPEGPGAGGDPGPGHDHRGGGDQAHVGPGQTDDTEIVRDYMERSLAGEMA